MDIVFIIDTSSYVEKGNFQKVKSFIKAIIRYFRIAPSHVRVGAISYSTWVRDEFNLNSYRNLRKVMRAVDRIQYVHGKQFTNRALEYARQISFNMHFGGRPSATSIAIVFTNGKVKNFARTLKQAELLKNEGVKVFIVAVGNVNMKGERAIASRPYKWFIIRVPDYETLEKYAWTMAYRIYWGKEKCLIIFINF